MNISASAGRRREARSRHAPPRPWSASRSVIALALAAAALLGAELVAGCAGRPGPRSAPPGATGSEVAVVVVRAEGLAPATLNVEVGDLVILRNDAQRRLVIASRGAAWEPVSLEPGAEWRHRFQEPGRYRFYDASRSGTAIEGVFIVLPRE